MRDPGTTTNEGGFTLLEVVMAMMILLVGMTGVALAQIQALRSGANSGTRSKALFLAEAQLETFQAMADNHIDLANSGHFRDQGNPINLDLSPGQNGNDYTQYYRCWQIERNDPTVSNLTRITVEVRVGTDCDTRDPNIPITTAVRLTGVK